MLSSSSLIWMFLFLESTLLLLFEMIIDPNSIDVPISDGQYTTSLLLSFCNKNAECKPQRKFVEGEQNFLAWFLKLNYLAIDLY